MKKLSFLFLLTVMIVGVSVSPAQAKITINSDFEGTVVITFPNGEIALIEPGDPIPEIPQGSTLEVFDGTFTVTTEEGDQCQISCLEHSATASDGASASLSCAEESGVLKVTAGSIPIVTPAGTVSDVVAGTEYPIQAGGAEQAPATAATEPAGTPVGDDAPPADSRSIESSPST